VRGVNIASNSSDCTHGGPLSPKIPCSVLSSQNKSGWTSSQPKIPGGTSKEVLHKEEGMGRSMLMRQPAEKATGQPCLPANAELVQGCSSGLRLLKSKVCRVELH